MASDHILFDSTNQAENERGNNCKRRAEEDSEFDKKVSGKRVRTAEESSNGCDTPQDRDVQSSQAERTCSYYNESPRNIFNSLKALRMGNPVARRTFTLPTARILGSFVSSHKADLYKFHSLSSSAFLTLPYACAFTNASKRGESSTLAVATEHGTVEVISTTKRHEWDPEGARSTFELHSNGIFDVKWSPNDQLLATASGDNTARICDPRGWKGEPLHILSGHSSTVKCLAWDPNHNDLLASAGRDGCICLWDLRESRKQETDMEVDDDAPKPTVKISYAHEPVAGKPTKKGRTLLASRGVTSLVYSPSSPYEIISSGSADGVIRKWDLRGIPSSPRKQSKKSSALLPIDEAVHDLTKVSASSTNAGLPFSPRRSRGITSLALGSGPTAGKIFALGNDSRVHTYNPLGAAGSPLDIPQAVEEPYSHRHMTTNSFYVRIGTSPCGKWLASGGTNGSAFVFDVGSKDMSGFELRGQEGEVGALDWAEGALATCADDGTVRIWRPDLDQHRACCDNPEEEQYSWSWAKL